MGPWALPIPGYDIQNKTGDENPWKTTLSLPLSGLVSDVTVALSLTVASNTIEMSLVLQDFEIEVT
jgi:hypothetical protein